MIARISDVRDPINARARVVRLTGCSDYLDAVIHELIECASEPDDLDPDLPCFHLALLEGSDSLGLLVEPHKLPPASRQFLLDAFGPIEEPLQGLWPSMRMCAQDSQGFSLPFPAAGSAAYLLGMQPMSPE